MSAVEFKKAPKIKIEARDGVWSQLELQSEF
jgi:hypothetical protein